MRVEAYVLPELKDLDLDADVEWMPHARLPPDVRAAARIRPDDTSWTLGRLRRDWRSSGDRPTLHPAGSAVLWDDQDAVLIEATDDE